MALACAQWRLHQGHSRKAEKEHVMMAFIQLDAGQSGCGATYRLTLGLSVPWLASMVALLHRLI